MDELKRLAELLNNALADLEKLRAAIDAFRQTDASDLDRLRKATKILIDRLEQTYASLRAGLTESAEIAKRLLEQGQGPGEKPVAGVLATDLAKGFRSVIQTIQREVGEGDVGEVGTIIRSMDVELKGLISVQDQQPTIMPPAPDQPVDANLLSTIRMSFASVPLQRAAGPIADTGPGPAPRRAQPPGGRASRPRRGAGGRGRGQG
jgi:hypothetical protein